ncbi:hypothetical protein CGRA01v4_07262 [Colletotrichum graminicola]|nr:hypothetical protein CGRA01v4_07262 [Colletotrichum graminicola]
MPAVTSCVKYGPLLLPSLLCNSFSAATDSMHLIPWNLRNVSPDHVVQGAQILSIE